MPFDAYVKLEGIDGESSVHSGAIEITNYGFGVSHPVSSSPGTAGAVPSGKADLQPFTFTKFVDKSSPKLFLACTSGQPIKKASMELYRSTGGKKLKFLEYKMTNCLISAMGRGGDTTASGDVPIESITLVMGTLEMTYAEQDQKTFASKGNVSAGWDFHKDAKV